jgi:DNA-binding response OmpR family regulator
MSTVLVVEPVDIIRHSLVQALVRAGFGALQTDSGPGALAILDSYQEPVHLLVTEVVLDQDMNGVDLASEVQSRRQSTLVLYLSAKPPILKAELFLAKPFTAEEFIVRVGKLLDRRRGDRRGRTTISDADAAAERRLTDRRNAPTRLSRFTLNPLTGARQTSGIPTRK